MRKELSVAGLVLATGLTLSVLPAAACPGCGSAVTAQATSTGNPAVGFAVGGAALLTMPFALVAGFGLWIYRLTRPAPGGRQHSTPTPSACDAEDLS